MEQLSLLEKAFLSDNLKRKKRSVKRRWEYAFQKWQTMRQSVERHVSRKRNQD